MGKKSRTKRKSKEWIKKTPDEVFRYGPLSIERYGRFIKFSNHSTPEQHADFLERSKEAHKEIVKTLEEEVSLLQEKIGKYDPVEIMHRAAYMLIPLFIQYRSENEFSSDESYYLPTTEYLQYLISRTQFSVESNEFTEEVWQQIWEQGLKLLRLMQSYLLTRKTLSTPPSQIDELRYDIDGRRLLVRVKRYPIFLKDYLRTSLTPYERWIKELYGLDVETIIQELGNIEEYQKIGVTERYTDVVDMTKVLCEALEKEGYAVGPEASFEEMEKTRAALESEQFQALHEEMQEKGRLAFTPALFEITNLTTLPKPFLSLLSVKPGEAILTTLTGPKPDYDDLSPLSTSVLHYKPFLEKGGKFYTFYHSGFEDRMAEIIEADLFKKRPDSVSVMAKERSNYIEIEARNLLASILKPDTAYLNVYYPNPDEVGGLTELDLLIEVGDILFLVEVKAGGFSAGASRGAPESIVNELSDLIIKGQQQSERAEKYVRSCDEAVFFDETGKRKVCRIEQSKYRKIFRVVITKEDLGWVGAKIAILSVIEPNLSISYPWHISLDDLRVVADLFQNEPIQFIHYLERRLQVSAEEAIQQSDEIEHVALYHAMNHYHELPVKEVTQLRYDSSYMRNIDYYFMSKSVDEVVEKPTQEMPKRMRALLTALNNCSFHHRFEIGSMLLDLSLEWRTKISEMMGNMEQKMLEGRKLTSRIPFPQLYGFSITFADDPYWEEEIKRSAVQMVQGGCKRWLVIQLENSLPYEVGKIELILPGMFTLEQLADQRQAHERKTLAKISADHPGRNAPCPCGSGKKYKKCHGFNA